MKYYVRYPVAHQSIIAILEKLKKKQLNIFIDIQSICKGFYNRDVVLMELGHYTRDGKISNILIEEMRSYMNDLYHKFKQYDPYFVLFYDDGYCQQNKIIMSEYKAARTTLNLLLEHDHEVELFRQIKRYYYEELLKFNKSDLCHVYYLREYEADCIPHYCLMHDLFDSQNKDVLNVILSVDKDLLQTCKFRNTLQHIVNYTTKAGKRLIFDLYYYENAIGYFHKNFKRGILTAEHIPLILSICGDKSDHIPSVQRGVGPVKACKLIETHNIPSNLIEIKNNLQNMPSLIQDNIVEIERNMKIIDFELQIGRMPSKIFN